jgi:hypothetical protein
MVAVILAFFGLAVLLVRACDAIIGPDPAPPDVAGGDEVTALAGNDLDLVPS